jgi:hypothetical protein
MYLFSSIDGQLRTAVYTDLQSATAVADRAFPLIQVEFELVEAVPGRALLRVAAEPAGAPPEGLLTLLVTGDGDRNPLRVGPLPAPAAPPGVVRAAFTIATAAAEAASGYSLELPDGTVMPLPKPTRRRTARITPAPPSTAPSDASGIDADPAITLLRSRLQEERDRRVGAETQAAASSAARVAALQRLDSLEDEVAELRAELRAAHGQVELSRTQANHARAEADAAERALTQRQAEIELLRVAVQERDTQSRHSYDHWEQIAAELSSDVDGARTETDAFRRHADELQLALASAQVELQALRETDAELTGSPAEPAELQRQLNRAAVALEESRKREAAAQAELEKLRSDD